MRRVLRSGGDMEYVVPVFMIIMGAAMAVIWTKDIVAGEQVDRSKGLFRARDVDGTIFWYHWVAEYSTAALLIVGGLGLLFGAAWATYAALLGLGALLYTSINSLGWAFAFKERYSYAAPMMVGLVGGILSAAWIVVSAV